MKLSFRQVHLDFHTSEAIPDIGYKFSKQQFQKALQIGHISSITVFSKCHHGWAYHPSKANEMHPNLSFDLLSQQIEAAHEIGVKTPVYLSAGLDEKMAVRNPQWLIRTKDETPAWSKSFIEPGYHLMCFNTPYLDYLVAQVEEVVSNYDADGIFLDITNIMPCYCSYCRKALKDAGKDILIPEDVKWLAERTYANYTKRIREAVDKIKPGLPVFHNGGHIRRGRRDLAAMDTHLELESLPTGGWGYDHFPLSAAYARTLGMEFLGMTGKFHLSWGEFGGYKHPNALRYEAALNIANGSKCSVGDQLHPSGFMDEATYGLIGAAYSEVEEKEAWCDDVTAVADIAVFSNEAADNMNKKEQSGKTGKSDTGAARILLEGKYLFNVVDHFEDLSKYKLIILPDNIRISKELKEKLDAFVKNGGKILATGESGLSMDSDEFLYDFGVKCEGANAYNPDYFVPDFELKSLGNAAFVMYSEGMKVTLDGGDELGKRENTYFNRTVEHFCSHQHTPCSGEYGGPGMAQGKDGIYIAWKVFDDYATTGGLVLKEMVCHAIDKLLGNNKTLRTSLPAQGVTTLMEQKMQKRYVNHLLYASPVKRGNNVEIIEDVIPVYNVEVSLKLPNKDITRVYLAPQMENLDYTMQDGVIKYTVPKLENHQMIVLDY